MRKLALIAMIAGLVSSLVPSLAAQRMGGAAPHFGGHFSSYSSPGFGSQYSPFGSRSFAYPIPFFTDSLYSDAVYPIAYGPVQPLVVVMQAPPAPDPAPARPSEPLLIELQGDRYVRISGEGASGAQMIDQEGASTATANAPPASAAREATAILLFRDGRTEEVSDYTITDGVLYVRGNYYIDGSWSRKIALSSLNLPETIGANRTRGVKFQLPTFPNEVIVGP